MYKTIIETIIEFPSRSHAENVVRFISGRRRLATLARDYRFDYRYRSPFLIYLQQPLLSSLLLIFITLLSVSSEVKYSIISAAS